MNRQDFIASLRKELSKLPPEEIADATEFYEEYFDEVLENLDEETDGALSYQVFSDDSLSIKQSWSTNPGISGEVSSHVTST